MILLTKPKKKVRKARKQERGRWFWKQAGMPLTIPGVPFILQPVNIPTMPPAYVAGVAGAAFNTVVDVVRGRD